MFRGFAVGDGTSTKKEKRKKSKESQKPIDKRQKIGYNNSCEFMQPATRRVYGDVLKLAEEAPLLRV